MDFPAVASALSEFFSVSGVTVSRVEGGEVALEGHSRLRPGMKLALLRGGQVFRHPVTGEPFGTGEKEVGLVEVKSLDETGARASLVSGSAKAGDKARLQSSTGRILVAYQESIDPRPVDRLYEELEKISGLVLMDGGSGTAEAVLTTAWEKGANALVYLREKGARIAVSLYISGQGASEPAEEWLLEYETPKPEPSGDEKTALLTDVPWFHFILPFRASLVAAGDIDGDGRENLLISGRNGINIYSLEKSDLRDVNVIPVSAGSEIFDLSTFDLDNDGSAEIIVTTVDEEGHGLTTDNDVSPTSPASVDVSTLIFGFSPDAGFSRKDVIRGFFARATERGVLLQAYSDRDGFSGQLFILEKEGDGFARRPAGDAPEGSNLYSFSSMGDTTLSYAGKGNLVLSDRSGNDIWRSAETFGGGEPSFNLPSRLGQDSRKISRRLPFIRKNAASRDFFAFRNNPMVGALPGFGFKSCDIYGLRLGDREVTDIWSMPDIAASVKGMAVLDDGRLAVVLVPTITGSKALFGSWAYFKSNSAVMILDPRRRQ